MERAPEDFEYIADFLSFNEQATLLDELRSLTYQHDVFRGQTMKRGWVQFGYNYVSIGRRLEAAPPIPPFLQTIIQKALPYCPNNTEFTQCIVTNYPVGAGIGWHTDASCFDDCILGISLASEARLQFKANGSKQVSFEVKAAPGSLYIMQGAARWNYEHQIIPVRAERYSLTFRSVT